MLASFSRAERCGNAMAEGASGRPITLAEVERHQSRSDCWVCVHGKVYDITHWYACLRDRPVACWCSAC